jgi:dephospho-CoA kinase
MLIIGLTGSIAMGKSETLKMFARLGCAVFDADAAVHQLYAKNGAAVSPIASLVPQAVRNAEIDRSILSKHVVQNPALLANLETIVHPLVRQAEDEFVRQQRHAGAQLVVLDIPLLFETGRQAEFDRIVVVSAPADIQRQRALERPGMTAEKFQQILSRQVPDAKKRAKADYVVDTSKGLDAAFEQVRQIVAELAPDLLQGETD